MLKKDFAGTETYFTLKCKNLETEDLRFTTEVCSTRIPEKYSQVPNKRGGVRIIGGGGLEMVRHNNNRGGCLEK